MSSGKIVQVIGPVVDMLNLSLDRSLPDISNALVVYRGDDRKRIEILGSDLGAWRWSSGRCPMEINRWHGRGWKLSIL